MINANKTVFLIVMVIRSTRQKWLRVTLRGLDGKLKLFYLPPYSPHLNPDETVWAHVKRKVSRQLVECRGR